jgi:hypothetical protein
MIGPSHETGLKLTHSFTHSFFVSSHPVRWGSSRPRGPQQGVSLEELSAYYSPLTIQRVMPGCTAAQRQPLAITRELLATIKVRAVLDENEHKSSQTSFMCAALLLNSFRK